VEIAHLVLDYVNALKWPCFVIALTLIFRDPLAQLVAALRPKSITAPGVAAEFFEERVEVIRAAQEQALEAAGTVSELSGREPDAADTRAFRPPYSSTEYDRVVAELESAAYALISESPFESDPGDHVRHAQAVLKEQVERSLGVRAWSNRQVINTQALFHAGLSYPLAGRIAEIEALGDLHASGRVTPQIADSYRKTVAMGLIGIARTIRDDWPRESSPAPTSA
jgi:hypothetical protein